MLPVSQCRVWVWESEWRSIISMTSDSDPGKLKLKVGLTPKSLKSDKASLTMTSKTNHIESDCLQLSGKNSFLKARPSLQFRLLSVSSAIIYWDSVRLLSLGPAVINMGPKSASSVQANQNGPYCFQRPPAETFRGHAEQCTPKHCPIFHVVRTHLCQLLVARCPTKQWMNILKKLIIMKKHCQAKKKHRCNCGINWRANVCPRSECRYKAVIALTALTDGPTNTLKTKMWASGSRFINNIIKWFTLNFQKTTKVHTMLLCPGAANSSCAKSHERSFSGTRPGAGSWPLDNVFLQIYLWLATKHSSNSPPKVRILRRKLCYRPTKLFQLLLHLLTFPVNVRPTKLVQLVHQSLTFPPFLRVVPVWKPLIHFFKSDESKVDVRRSHWWWMKPLQQLSIRTKEQTEVMKFTSSHP